MGELIGVEMEIVKSTRRELIGLKGEIVDETMSTFVVEGKKKEIVVPKKFCTFRFHKKSKSIEIEGNRLMFRPEDRIKKYWRKFHGKKRGM